MYKKEQNIKIFKKIISNYCGLELDRQRDSLVMERIIDKIKNEHKNDIESYLLDLVRNDNKELFKILNELTINETYFFRHYNQFELFRHYIINLLNKTKQGKIYIWSAACATGCEPYSIAILLEELKEKYYFDYQIFATDIDDNVLKTAKSGIYSKRAVTAEMPDIYLKKYFDELGLNGAKKYKIKDKLKQNINFSKHNLLQDIYPRNLDAIFCRNVLIYFSKYNITKIINLFFKSLKKDGLLFLAPAETLHSNRNYFEEYKLPNSNIKAFRKWSTDRRDGEQKPDKQIINLRKPLDYYPLPSIELVQTNKNIIFVKGIIKGEKRIKKIERDFYKVCGKLSSAEPESYELNLNELRWLSNNALKKIISLIEYAKKENLYMINWVCNNNEIKYWFNKAGINQYIKFTVSGHAIRTHKSGVCPNQELVQSFSNTNKGLVSRTRPGIAKTGTISHILNNTDNKKGKNKPVSNRIPDKKNVLIKIANIETENEMKNYEKQFEEIIGKIEQYKKIVLDFKNCLFIKKEYFKLIQQFCNCIYSESEIIAKCYNNFGIEKLMYQFNLDKKIKINED